MSSSAWHTTLEGRKPLNVVIVSILRPDNHGKAKLIITNSTQIGGSLAGLMHGIMIKQLGHNVRILEQTTSSVRTDQAAGMGTGPQGREFFEQHDVYAKPYSFACPGFQFLDKEANIKRTLNLPLNLTSWNVLYYRLRANFDAFESTFCPNPLWHRRRTVVRSMIWARNRPM